MKKKLTSEYQEYFSLIAGSSSYPALKKFLQVQMNNIAVLSWFRIKSTDTDLSRKKAYYEGQVDFIKSLIDLFEQAKKSEDDV